MEFCTSNGIPHSKFLSWPEEDQDEALMFLLNRKTNCPRCGTNPDDWLDDQGRHIEPQPYETVAILCLGCEAISDKRKEVDSSVLSGSADHYHVHLRPRVRNREQHNLQGPDVGGPSRNRQGIRRG